MAKCNQEGCACRDPKLGRLDRKVALFWRDRAAKRGAGPTRTDLAALPVFEPLTAIDTVAGAPYSAAFSHEATAWAGEASGTCLCALRCKGRCDNLLTIASRAVCADCANGYHAKSEGD